MEQLRRFNKLLIAFTILLQPELDMFRRLVGANFEVFGFSLLELINILLIGVIFLLTVITYPEKRKLLKWLWLLIPYIGYFILHYYNITHFNNSVFPDQYVSVVTEFYYLFRVFMLPLVLIFSIYYSGIKKEDLFQILELFILITAGFIVVLNLFNLSFLSYDSGFLAVYNIFDWFSFDGSNYQDIATKGWFNSGNQLSAILFMLLPITLYLAYSKKTKYNYFLLILQIIAMMMLGTKVANVGCLLVLFAFIVIAVFKKFILKKKLEKIRYIIIITILSCGLFIVSPRGYDLLHKDIENDPIGGNGVGIGITEKGKIDEISCQNLSNEDKITLDIFMHFNQAKLRFPDFFIDSYPLDYNYSYWCYMIKNGLVYRNQPIDYRVMKSSMLQQIYINNDNALDKLVGMGYTLNFIYTEEDYTYQFYSYGILGLILFVGPYLLICLFLIIKFLRRFKDSFNIQNTLLILALLLGLIVPYLSGHVLERSFPLYVLAFICVINLISAYGNISEGQVTNDEKNFRK